jgi:murein DD-endopeptidase MepM/ murein hydrolase activator NlpD
MRRDEDLTLASEFTRTLPKGNPMSTEFASQTDYTEHVDEIKETQEASTIDRRGFLKTAAAIAVASGGLAATMTAQPVGAWSFNPATYVTPLTRAFPVTQWYGPGTYSHRSGENAKAIDIGSPVGMPVYAPKNGTIAFEGWEGPGGIVCRINHDDGLQTIFAHLSRTVVDNGWRVYGNSTLIGYTGATGNVSGAHLHWALKIQGTSTAINLDNIPGVTRHTIYP